MGVLLNVERKQILLLVMFLMCVKQSMNGFFNICQMRNLSCICLLGWIRGFVLYSCNENLNKGNINKEIHV